MGNVERTCRDCGNNTFYEGKMGNYVTVFPMNAFWTGMTSGNHVKVLICKKCNEINSMKVTSTVGFEEEKEEPIIFEKNSTEGIVQELVETYKRKYGLKTSQEITLEFGFEFINELAESFIEKDLGNVEVITEDYLRFDDGYQIGYEFEDDEEVLRNLPSSGWNLKAIEQIFHSKFPENITLEQMNGFGIAGHHMWLEFNGKFYDAECPIGVESLFELPFYKRFFENKIKK